MWYQNIRSALFSFVTVHASDGQTDRQTDEQTELRQQYRALYYMQSHGKKTKPLSTWKSEAAKNRWSHSDQDRQTHIVTRHIFIGRGLNAVGKEAEYGANPQQDREAAKQLFAELDPLGRRLGRRQLVTAVTP